MYEHVSSDPLKYEMLVRAAVCSALAVMRSENVQMLYLSAYECKI